MFYDDNEDIMDVGNQVPLDDGSSYDDERDNEFNDGENGFWPFMEEDDYDATDDWDSDDFDDFEDD